MNGRTPILLLALGLSQVINLSQGGATLNTAQFGAGARPTGLGGAYTAVADDANSAVWNAANMAVAPCPELTASHTLSYLGTTLDNIAGILPARLLGRRTSIGFFLFRAATEGIPVTEGSQDTAASGSLPVVGRFAIYSVGLSLGREIVRPISAGMTGWIGRSELVGITALGTGLDASLSMSLGRGEDDLPHLNISTVTRGFGETWSWSTGHKETAMRNLLLALAYRPWDGDRLTLSLDIDDIGLDKTVPTDLRMGAEFLLSRAVSLRLGYNADAVAVGAGLKSDHVKIDYAFSFHRELAGSHCISMAVVK